MNRFKDVYIVAYKRSAFSRAHPDKKGIDLFKDIRGDELLATLIKDNIKKAHYSENDIDDLTIGCALNVKEQWSFGGKYPAYMADLGFQCASRMVEQQCGSGIAAIKIAMLSIASGHANIAYASGYENMSRIPMGPTLFDQGMITNPVNKVPDHYDMNTILNRGITAENLAKKGNISRVEMDEFAFNSHTKANHSVKSNFLNEEILIIKPPQGVADKDTNIRPEINIKKLSELNSAFIENGDITAGNSSPLTSGAGLITLMSTESSAKFQ
ncbi:MAG: thiolase family protein [Ostreibacterium sp.]